jgi:beta-phosphoglucomutase
MQEAMGTSQSQNGTPESCKAGNLAAVIFDWDGVLVDSRKNYYRAYELVLQEVGILTTPREIYLREGQPTPQVISALCLEHGIQITEERVKELVQRRREYDIALGPRTFFPGIWELVGRLRKSGCKLAIVTGSSRRSLQLVLTAAQERYFDVVITADDVTRPKPDPQPFLLAAANMGVVPSQCVVVENAPFGIRAARAAGCRVVALCTTLSPDDLSEADWILGDHQGLELLFAAQ